jgi:hypothetical protein
MNERFLIRRAWWLRPLLFLVGFTRDSNSYVSIEGEELRVRFGWFFNQRIPLAQIESVGPMRWPWYYGLGWRANLVGLIGLVASFQGVVQVRLKERRKIGGILPFVKLPCDRLAVSLDEPEAFMAVLQRSIQ